MKTIIVLLCSFFLMGASSCRILRKNTSNVKVHQAQKTEVGVDSISINDHIPPPLAKPPIGAALIAYKTKKDYSNLVSIELSADKSRIVSYPDPKDISNHSKPTLLKDGYCLDNRGISQNVAFIKLTYAEYAQLAKAPTVDSLKAWIIDKDPLLAFYNCGLRYQYPNPAKSLNALIEKGELGQTCRTMK